MYRCKKCNFDVPLDKKDLHNEYCKQLPDIQELNNYIPCELCNESIEIDKYNRHFKACVEVDKFYTYLRNPYLLGNLIVNNSQNNNNSQNSQNNNNSQNNTTNSYIEQDENSIINNFNINQNDNNIGNINNINNIEQNENNCSININIQIGGVTTSFPLRFILNILNPDVINDQNSTLINDMIEIIQNESTYDEYQNNIELAEEIGKVEVGVDNIENVTSVINNNIEDVECPICKEPLNSFEIVRETKCKHLYCNDCITKWLKKNKSCPICNNEL